jgi:broad specificity phosphatase PhoE
VADLSGTEGERRSWAVFRVVNGTARQVVVPHGGEGEWTRVHLVRHGTTILNRASRYRGRRDVPLDQGGWDDAWAAGGELEHSGPAAIYSSPLRRARDTARIIADVTGLEQVTDLPALVNLDYGDREGLTSAGRHRYDPSWFGIQSGEVAERFRSYTDRFELA